MLRRLTTPRWLALHLLALVMVLACVRLGFWQLDRARLSDAPPVTTNEAAVPLVSLGAAQDTLPASAAGQLVTATGTYDKTHQYLVVDRSQDGADGRWVLSVLRLAAGSGVLVVRGWVPDGTPAPAPPPGVVSVTGRVQASEAPGGDLPIGETLPAGAIAAVSPIDLLSKVPYPLYDAYVVLTEQAPPPQAGLALVPAPAEEQPSVPGFFLQHVAYVGLWWIFGLFVIFFWWRLMRDELDEAEAEPSEIPG